MSSLWSAGRYCRPPGFGRSYALRFHRFGRRHSANAHDTLPLSLFQQALLCFLLALDTVACPRHRFQALGVDLLAARDALSKTALANTRQRALDHLQQLPVIIALVKEKFFGVRAGSAVGNVLRRILIDRTPVLLRTRDHAPQLMLPRFQPLLECFQFLFVHG